jgi:N4-gp56 family major capsid protein
LADNPVVFQTISNDAPNVFIAQNTYRIAELNMQLGKFARKERLPQRMSKTMRLIRHKRIALPRGPLTEGVPPSSTAMQIENVDIPTEQWGIVVLMSDVSQVTTKHPILNVAIERKALAMTEMFEREIAQTLLAGTKVIYAGSSNAARGDLAAGDKVTTATVLGATVGLRNHGAVPMSGTNYGGVMPPQVEGDLVSTDTTFTAAAEQSNIKALQMGDLGVWMGVDWQRGNFLPVFAGVGAPGTQNTEEAGYASEVVGGSALANANITVVAKDAISGYERKVSQEKAMAATADSAVLTTPTSTNYVYDIYVELSSVYKLVYEDVPANTAKSITLAAYNAGTTQSPPAAPADTVEVFVSWVFGKDAFARVELDGMSLQSFITPDTASWSNPLAQGRKVGSKAMWKCAIVDDNYMRRIESGSTFSADLPA